jgi:hypothetical protein
MLGDKIATMKQGARNDLPQICGKSTSTVVSQTQAAAMLNISVRSIQKARTVRAHGVQALQEVEAGKVSVSLAAAIARRPSSARRGLPDSPMPCLCSLNQCGCINHFSRRLQVLRQ